MTDRTIEREQAADCESLDRVVATPPGLGVGVCIGRVAALSNTVPLVDFPFNSSGELNRARTLVAIGESDIGRAVVLAFEENDPAKPIILGILPVGEERAQPDTALHATVSVTADGKHLLLEAAREITLRCGKASLTLTSAGKVLIEGEYVSSRSSGVNKIRGGSIQLN